MNKKIVILGYSGSVHIIRWARGINLSGFDVTVISSGGPEIAGLRTIIYGRTGHAADYFRFYSRVQKEIKSINPHLIHAFQTTGYGLWGAGKFNCPKLLTALGSDILLTGGRTALHRYYSRYVLKRYSAFTAPSEFLKRKMNELSSFTSGNTTVIPFGVELPDCFKVHQENSPVRLVYMKLLSKIYGPHLLLEALSYLKKSKINVRLDMYGSGPEETSLREMADRLGIAENVSFKGWLDMNLVATKYLEYDIMVMPSLSESFGVAALEASAAGLPVVATNIGGIPEAVMNGVTGILVKPGDAEVLAGGIKRLAENVELRKKMGEAGRKYVSERFNWQDNLNQMLQLYSGLMRSKE